MASHDPAGAPPTDRLTANPGYAIGQIARALQALQDGADMVKGSRWVNDQLVNFDEGFATAYVAVPGDGPDLVDVWVVEAHKNFLAKGKVTFDTLVPYVIGKMRPARIKK